MIAGITCLSVDSPAAREVIGSLQVMLEVGRPLKGDAIQFSLFIYVFKTCILRSTDVVSHLQLMVWISESRGLILLNESLFVLVSFPVTNTLTKATWGRRGCVEGHRPELVHHDSIVTTAGT